MSDKVPCRTILRIEIRKSRNATLILNTDTLTNDKTLILETGPSRQPLEQVPSSGRGAASQTRLERAAPRQNRPLLSRNRWGRRIARQRENAEMRAFMNARLALPWTDAGANR